MIIENIELFLKKCILILKKILKNSYINFPIHELVYTSEI